MPQFDFYTFSGQVFWTLVGFSFFYFFILKYYLVSFSETFKIRQKLYNKTSFISDITVSKKQIFEAFV